MFHHFNFYSYVNNSFIMFYVLGATPPPKRVAGNIVCIHAVYTQVAGVFKIK
jgi:hypothetical protein